MNICYHPEGRFELLPSSRCEQKTTIVFLVFLLNVSFHFCPLTVSLNVIQPPMFKKKERPLSFPVPCETSFQTSTEVVKNILNTERGRCLFIIKNSLIHQARLATLVLWDFGRFAQVCSISMVYLLSTYQKKIFEPKVGRYIRTCYGFGFSAPDLAERPKHFKQVFFVLLYSCASD